MFPVSLLPYHACDVEQITGLYFRSKPDISHDWERSSVQCMTEKKVEIKVQNQQNYDKSE